MKTLNSWLLERMGPRGVKLVKLVLWAGVLTWMLFWLAYAVVMARQVAFITAIYGSFGEPWGSILVWVAPVFIVFTALCTDVFIARWVYRKLR